MNERSTRKQLIPLAVAAACMLAGLLASPASAQKAIEKFQGNAMVTGGTGAGASSVLEILIYRWSTEEERQELIAAVQTATAGKPNNREVAKALRGQTKAGYAFFAGNQGWPLRFSRQIEVNGKRRIIVATDRPVSFQEVYSQSRLGDFDVSLLVMDVDENGNGEGVLSLGTEVIWDEQENGLKITNVSSQPIRVTNIRKVQ